jgi:hypothetical protein
MNKGNIGMGQLLIVGGGIVVAIISGWFGQTNRTDAKLETVKTEQNANVLTISQRVSVNETKTENLQKDVSEIKSDVKTLLKLLK